MNDYLTKIEAKNDASNPCVKRENLSLALDDLTNIKEVLNRSDKQL